MAWERPDSNLFFNYENLADEISEQKGKLQHALRLRKDASIWVVVVRKNTRPMTWDVIEYDDEAYFYKVLYANVPSQELADYGALSYYKDINHMAGQFNLTMLRQLELYANTTRKNRAAPNPLSDSEMAKIIKNRKVPPKAFQQMGRDQLAKIIALSGDGQAAKAAEAELTRRAENKAAKSKARRAAANPRRGKR